MGRRCPKPLGVPGHPAPGTKHRIWLMPAQGGGEFHALGMGSKQAPTAQLRGSTRALRKTHFPEPRPDFLEDTMSVQPPWSLQEAGSKWHGPALGGMGPKSP